MKKLKAYLATLPPQDRIDLAERCGTTMGHLRNVSYGDRPASEGLAAAIERESAGAVKCEEMRPDVRWFRQPDCAWPWHPKGKPLVDVVSVD
jgi:DNA-binding transcriptional regulator YdaS (Cro superfamily)